MSYVRNKYSRMGPPAEYIGEPDTVVLRKGFVLQGSHDLWGTLACIEVDRADMTRDEMMAILKGWRDRHNYEGAFISEVDILTKGGVDYFLIEMDKVEEVG